MIKEPRISVGLLGATGLVGQRFIQLLDNHPYFELSVIGASSRSSCKTYENAVSFWTMSNKIPSYIASKAVVECKVENFSGCKLVFSALDASVAGEIEREFVLAGIAVFSNSRNFRMDPSVPLVVPLVNHDHIRKDILCVQQKQKEGSSFIVTNANCSTTGLAVALKPLFDKYGLKRVFVHTMQAISGAGYPGVSSIQIIDNVIPFISGEEEKIQTELLKILGTWTEDSEESGWIAPDIVVSASCNRVNVIDGHTLNISVELASDLKPSIEELEKLYEEYDIPDEIKSCPSSPMQPIVTYSNVKNPERPQPRLDRFKGNGMSISVGRIRQCPLFDFKFSCIVHNTILGAAGSAVLNAEIAVKRGTID